jgi:DNA-binding NtrC family response regulator
MYGLKVKKQKNMNHDFPIIIVDDEPEMCLTIEGVLQTEGFRRTIRCEKSEALFPVLKANNPAIVLLDLNMPGKSGQELLPEIKSSFPASEVIILTSMNDVDTAVSCIKNGAFDYLVKPLDPNSFINCVNHAIDIYSLRGSIDRINERFLEKQINHPDVFSKIITRDNTMLNIFSYCEAIASGNQPVFITGETGVGKELIAQAIHSLSGRKGKFVAVNIAGLDKNMLSSSLFGHLKGAFTGADKDKSGLIEEAAGGTLFLDEIGDMDVDAQIKLLRLLQEYEFLPVGAVKPKKTETRVLTATHMDMDQLLENGDFRPDLYYRLSTHHIHIPTLKERLNDIPLLLDFFLEEAAQEYKKKKPTYPPELISLLKTYHFPGNVRELRSMVLDAVSVHKSRKLSMKTFKARIQQCRKMPYKNKINGKEIIFPDVLPTIKENTELLIREALDRADQNQKIAAELLGITQQALNKRLRQNKKSDIIP